MVRSLLLATLLLAFGAASAQAAVTVDMKVTPSETTYGERTEVTGTALQDGVPLAGQPVVLEGRRYPYDDEFAALDEAVTAPDGTYEFKRRLDRNRDLRVRVGDALSDRERTYVFPASTLTFRARSANVIRVTQRYRVPRGVRLEKPTIFYVGKRGRKRAPRAATGELKRIRAGRYKSTAIVRLPRSWKGKFRYASCFRYTGGSGMGNPRASCPRRFRF